MRARTKCTRHSLVDIVRFNVTWKRATERGSFCAIGFLTRKQLARKFYACRSIHESISRNDQPPRRRLLQARSSVYVADPARSRYNDLLVICYRSCSAAHKNYPKYRGKQANRTRMIASSGRSSHLMGDFFFICYMYMYIYAVQSNVRQNIPSSLAECLPRKN